MWHTLSHYAQTDNHALGIGLFTIPLLLFWRQVQTKQTLPAVVLLTLSAFAWFTTQEINRWSLLFFFFTAASDPVIVALRNRHATVRKPSA